LISLLLYTTDDTCSDLPIAASEQTVQLITSKIPEPLAKQANRKNYLQATAEDSQRYLTPKQ
jgi:hypothetical protein